MFLPYVIVPAHANTVQFTSCTTALFYLTLVLKPRSILEQSRV